MYTWVCVCVRRYYMPLPTLHSTYTCIPSSKSLKNHETLSSSSFLQLWLKLLCPLQRGELQCDRLRSEGPDLGGPLPARRRQPVAHPEHGQHAQLQAERRRPPLPAALPKQPLRRKSHDPGDGVAVSAFLSLPESYPSLKVLYSFFTYASQTGDSLLARKVPGGSWFQIAAR